MSLGEFCSGRHSSGEISMTLMLSLAGAGGCGLDIIGLATRGHRRENSGRVEQAGRRCKRAEWAILTVRLARLGRWGRTATKSRGFPPFLALIGAVKALRDPPATGKTWPGIRAS